MAANITMTNVSKRYGARVAVQDLNLEVNSGEVVGLLGANGAGKSTTLYLLSGLLKPDSGSIQLFGRDLHKHFLDIAPRMGVLPERPVFVEYMTVRQNLALQARYAQFHGNFDRILDLAGLLNHADAKARVLSQGYRQRLGLAQAMLTEPQLLLLDEPMALLDIETSLEILHLLRRLAEHAGVTIVFSTHQLHRIEQLCDRVALLDNGHLVHVEAIGRTFSFDPNHMEVILDGPDTAAKRLREQAWVQSVEVRHGRLVVQLEGESAHQLNAFLVNAGYKVDALIPRRRTMREYAWHTAHKRAQKDTPT